jgi:hypothetical protein
MVAGTAAFVGVALRNDRRLTPVFVESTPAPLQPSRPAPRVDAAVRTPDPRAFIAQRFRLAATVAVIALAVVAALPAITAFAFNMRDSTPDLAPMQGPPMELRAAAGVSGNWEQSYTTSQPSSTELGNALIAGEVERRQRELESALVALGQYQEQQEAARQAQQSQVRGAAVAPANPVRTLGRGSGYAVGTVLSARITVYGCTGPGGGFCGNMSTGIRVFEGAAACSYNLPFGTKFRIVGDATGRTYECLDRGALSATWVDVFFHNTSQGIAWAGNLGGTRGQIEIVN